MFNRLLSLLTSSKSSHLYLYFKMGSQNVDELYKDSIRLIDELGSIFDDAQEMLTDRETGK